jgi:hypothetical protein
MKELAEPVDEDQNWYLDPKIQQTVSELDEIFAEAVSDYADIEAGRL